MIITVKKAILHILDGLSGVSVFSDSELDVENDSITAFITKHIEKIYEDSSLRSGEFNSNSGFKYHLGEYLNGEITLQKFSVYVAEHLYEAISHSEQIDSSDLLVCDCIVSELPVMAVLKCDNKIGYTHQVLQNDGKISNEIINHYAILPSVSQKITECAFINLNDMSIKYKGKKRKIDGESVDLIADIMLEGVFDISAKEAFNAVSRIAKAVANDNGSDSVDAEVKIRNFVREAAIEDEYIEPKKVAEAVFDNSPTMREEFMEKVGEVGVPEKVEINDYVAKKATSNIKLVTDIGVELSFPAEFYRDDEHISIINNEDGTLSIQINNIGEIKNK